MENQMVSLVSFNNRAVAERALRTLESEGLNPVLLADDSDTKTLEFISEGEGDWLVLQTPLAEAEQATETLDSLLEEIDMEADEEEELALGQM